MSVARTTSPDCSAAWRCSRRKPASRAQSPAYGGFGSCACMPASRPTASVAPSDTRSSSSWRASGAGFSSLFERTSATRWRSVSVEGDALDAAVLAAVVLVGDHGEVVAARAQPPARARADDRLVAVDLAEAARDRALAAREPHGHGLRLDLRTEHDDAGDALRGAAGAHPADEAPPPGAREARGAATGLRVDARPRVALARGLRHVLRRAHGAVDGAAVGAAGGVVGHQEEVEPPELWVLE